MRWSLFQQLWSSHDCCQRLFFHEAHALQTMPHPQCWFLSGFLGYLSSLRIHTARANLTLRVRLNLSKRTLWDFGAGTSSVQATVSTSTPLDSMSAFTSSAWARSSECQHPGPTARTPLNHACHVFAGSLQFDKLASGSADSTWNTHSWPASSRATEAKPEPAHTAFQEMQCSSSRSEKI